MASSVRVPAPFQTYVISAVNWERYATRSWKLLQALFQPTVWEQWQEKSLKEEKCAQVPCHVLCYCKPHGGICVAAVTSAGRIPWPWWELHFQGWCLEARSWGQPEPGRDVVSDAPLPGPVLCWARCSSTPANAGSPLAASRGSRREPWCIS